MNLLRSRKGAAYCLALGSLVLSGALGHVVGMSDASFSTLASTVVLLFSAFAAGNVASKLKGGPGQEPPP